MSKEEQITITKDTEISLILEINYNNIEIKAKGLKIFDIIEWFEAVVNSIDPDCEVVLDQRCIWVDTDGLLLDYSRQNRWILVEKLTKEHKNLSLEEQINSMSPEEREQKSNKVNRK